MPPDARQLRQSETDARDSTTWRLQPPSACLVLWRKPRNPPFVAACALDPGMDATAAARPELLHGNSPSTLDARVPAIQRPSARSHRTVDNSLITGSIEYSTFLRFIVTALLVGFINLWLIHLRRLPCKKLRRCNRRRHETNNRIIFYLELCPAPYPVLPCLPCSPF